jgi:hypothetical protein
MELLEGAGLTPVNEFVGVVAEDNVVQFNVIVEISLLPKDLQALEEIGEHLLWINGESVLALVAKEHIEVAGLVKMKGGS